MERLGKTGILCPSVIYGTSYLGNLYRELTREEKLSLMQEWFRVSEGRVVIDSAGKYGAGLALEVIGQGLEELGILPEQITISNKLGWYRVPLESGEPTFEPGVWVNLQYDAVQRISYDGILDCWQQGCALLGGKYKPDLVSVHDPDEYLAGASDSSGREKRMADIAGAYRALFELKDRGLVKAVGVGAKDWHIIRELYQQIDFDWVMFANKLTLYHHPPEVLDFVRNLGKQGVGIINSAIFNAGFLTGGEYFDYRKVSEDDESDRPLLAWRRRFFSVCRQFGVAPGDACLLFALSVPEVTAVALNPGKPDRMLRNQQVIKEKLPAAFWQALKRDGLVDPGYPYL